MSTILKLEYPAPDGTCSSTLDILRSSIASEAERRTDGLLPKELEV